MQKSGHFRTGLLLLLILQLAGCSDQFMDEQKMLQHARDYLAAGDINAAAIELRNTLEENSNNAEARYLLASIYLDAGDFAGAEKEFRGAITSGWDAGEATAGLLRAKLGMGDFNAVVSESEPQSAWSAPIRATVLTLRALAHAALDKQDAAIADLQAARELDPGSVDVLKTEVQLKIIYGDQAGANDSLALALEHYPDNAELLLLHAGMISRDDPESAQADYRKIIDRDAAGFISAHGRVARLRLAQLQILGQAFEAAASTIKPLSRGGSRDPFVNYLNGLLAFQQGDYTRAEELLLKVLKIAPEHNPTKLLFGTVNYAAKNYEQAVYFLSKYVVAVPDNLVARKLLARSYILLGKNAEAGEVLQAAPASETSDSELLALVAMSELNRGRTAAGIAGLEQAVKVDPASTALRSELAKAYIEAGETGLAINELRGLLAQGGRQQQTEALLVLAHLRAGEHSEAITLVLDMVSRNPDDTAIQTLAGNVFAATGDLNEARRYLEKVVGRDPEFIPAIMSLASIEEQEKHYAKAAGLYKQLVDSGSPSVMPYLALARLAEKRGDQEAMRDWLTRAQQHMPTDLRPRIYLAEYYLRKGELAIARTHVKDALELSPEKPELLALSGRIYLVEQNYRQALQPLQALVKAEPGSVTAHILLGEAYLQMGKFDEARREIKTVLASEAGNTQAPALLARLEIKAGDLQQALVYSRQLQKDAPEAALGYELAGDSLMAGQQFAEAEREYQRAWQLQPDSRLLIKRSGNASRSGSPDTAIAWLDDWLQSHPDDTQVAQFLGTSLQQAGNKDRAIEIYTKVIETDPDNAVALNNLAGLYLADGRPEALELAERAWNQAQDNPGIQDTYGWALVQGGQYGRGLDLLAKALKALPDIPEVRYHHAVALYQAGDKAVALETLRELTGGNAQFEGRADAERLLKE
jgi:putative PEP-CTERM system TPR-repeat lipoprotein